MALKAPIVQIASNPQDMLNVTFCFSFLILVTSEL